MTAPRTTTRKPDVSIGLVIDEVKRYALQETTGPLKGAGRWLGMGVAGAATLGLGLCLLLLGLLRVIQTEWDSVSTGSWSWVPYLIVLLVCAAFIAVAISRINRPSLNKELE